MKYLLALFITIFVFQANAQKIRLTDTSNKWHYCWWYWGSTAGELAYYAMDSEFVGDTVVNGISYKEFLQWGPGLPDLIREDTVTHKIYVILSLMGNLDTQNERLLYDFSLGIGDTLQNGVTNKSYVTGLDSTLINNTWHKVWQFTCDNNFSYHVIEGLGSLYTMLFPLDPSWTLQKLCCFQNNQNVPALYPAVQSFDNVNSCNLSANRTNEKSFTVQVSPIPVEQNTMVKFSEKVKSGRLVIYNSIGQPVFRSKIENNNSINIGRHLTTPGTYMYYFLDSNSGKYVSGKIVK
jgi:hypothetical protein